MVFGDELRIDGKPVGVSATTVGGEPGEGGMRGSSGDGGYTKGCFLIADKRAGNEGMNGAKGNRGSRGPDGDLVFARADDR